MFHAIAVKTLTPSLKRAREICGAPQTPQILDSGTFDECYYYLIGISSHRTPDQMMDKAAVRFNGVPLFVTPEWSYFIIEDKS